MMTATQHVSINHGVDYERALEVLSNKAGRAFVQYLNAKKSGIASPAEIAELRDAYKDAQNESEALNRNDNERIHQILAAGRA